MKRTHRLLAVVVAGAALAAPAAYAAARASLPLGPAANTAQPTYQAYYDGHKDTYLVTDVSNKAQAKALHVNYSAELAAVKGAPDQYFIEGRAAAGQISVFGSEPGESDYNPIWDEVVVTWKSGVTPVVLKSDNQINALAKKGKLTKRDTHIELNAPVLKVGK